MNNKFHLVLSDSPLCSLKRFAPKYSHQNVLTKIHTDMKFGHDFNFDSLDAGDVMDYIQMNSHPLDDKSFTSIKEQQAYEEESEIEAKTQN